jgi:hypothetical protein
VVAQINQDWNGFSGSVFASSSELTEISPCGFGGHNADPNTTSCVFPAWQSWYKPLSGRDTRHSLMAVLLVNNGDTPQDLSFTFAEVPGLAGSSSSTFCLYDVWAGADLDGGRFGGYVAKAVAPHDSVFLKIHQCR